MKTVLVVRSTQESKLTHAEVDNILDVKGILTLIRDEEDEGELAFKGKRLPKTCQPYLPTPTAGVFIVNPYEAYEAFDEDTYPELKKLLWSSDELPDVKEWVEACKEYGLHQLLYPTETI